VSHTREQRRSSDVRRLPHWNGAGRTGGGPGQRETDPATGDADPATGDALVVSCDAESDRPDAEPDFCNSEPDRRRARTGSCDAAPAGAELGLHLALRLLSLVKWNRPPPERRRPLPVLRRSPAARLQSIEIRKVSAAEWTLSAPERMLSLAVLSRLWLMRGVSEEKRRVSAATRAESWRRETGRFRDGPGPSRNPTGQRRNASGRS